MDRRTFLISAGASAGVIALVGTKGEKVAALPVNRPAGVALDPLSVTKYVDELPRPGVMPKTSILADGIDYYEIAVRQFKQSILPASMNLPTTVWLAAFSLAWTAGLVVPGAPGGLGVFEAMLLLRLALELPQPALLAVALSYRVVVTLADALVATLIGLDQRLARRGGNSQ